MTATKTKKTKLVVREQEFADLLRQRKELASSIADSEKVLKEFDEKIFSAMVKENLTSVEIDGVGIAEIVVTGGSVTWDQNKLIELLKDGAKAREIDGADFMAEICALKARPSVADKYDLEIDSAKKVGKFTEKLKIS